MAAGEEAEADEAAVAATEWIPIFDIVDDVVGGAAAFALEAEAAADEAVASRKSLGYFFRNSCWRC